MKFTHFVFLLDFAHASIINASLKDYLKLQKFIQRLFCKSDFFQFEIQ